VSTYHQFAQYVESFQRRASPLGATVLAPGSQIPNFQSQVMILTNMINDDAARSAVSKVLTDLVFLLDCVSSIAVPRNTIEAREVGSLLDTVRSEACSLALFIEKNALPLDGLGDSLSDMLDSSAYAINHEVRRVFNGDLAHVSLDRNDQETRGAIQHARGVLNNCFQQCMINLARMFDSSLTSSGLFQDWQSRRESSLALYQDLSELIALVQVNLMDAPDRPIDYLEVRLASFRQGSMQSLMYKDWQLFESLTEAILVAMRRGESPGPPLHHMGCYLETLLAHVKSRSVLSDMTMEPLSIELL
jgi:hypothetical protein